MSSNDNSTTTDEPIAAAGPDWPLINNVGAFWCGICFSTNLILAIRLFSIMRRKPSALTRLCFAIAVIGAIHSLNQYFLTRFTSYEYTLCAFMYYGVGTFYYWGNTLCFLTLWVRSRIVKVGSQKMTPLDYAILPVIVLGFIAPIIYWFTVSFFPLNPDPFNPTFTTCMINLTSFAIPTYYMGAVTPILGVLLTVKFAMPLMGNSMIKSPELRRKAVKILALTMVAVSMTMLNSFLALFWAENYYQHILYPLDVTTNVIVLYLQFNVDGHAAPAQTPSIPPPSSVR